MAKAPRKPAPAKTVAPQIVAPLIDMTPVDTSTPVEAVAGAETAAAIIDAAVEATLAAPSVLPTVEATPAAPAALPTVEPAPISTIAADVVAVVAEPVVTASTAAPARAADAFADNVTALCESGAALAEGFERFRVRLADIAYANLHEGMALQRAMLGLGTTDALAMRGPAWVGERIGAFAAVPGELAMIAFETAEAAARPVVKRAQARFTGGAAGSIV